MYGIARMVLIPTNLTPESSADCFLLIIGMFHKEHSVRVVELSIVFQTNKSFSLFLSVSRVLTVRSRVTNT